MQLGWHIPTAMGGLTEEEIRKELADEEESLLNGGAATLHSTSMSSFMILALELEDSQ